MSSCLDESTKHTNINEQQKAWLQQNDQCLFTLSTLWSYVRQKTRQTYGFLMQSVIIHFALFSNDKRDQSFLDLFYALKPKVPVAFEFQDKNPPLLLFGFLSIKVSTFYNFTRLFFANKEVCLESVWCVCRILKKEREFLHARFYLIYRKSI